MKKEFFYYSLVPTGGFVRSLGWKDYRWGQMAGVFVNMENHNVDMVAIYGSMNDFMSQLDDACTFDLYAIAEGFGINPEIFVYFKMIEFNGGVAYGFALKSELNKLVDVRMFKINRKD